MTVSLNEFLNHTSETIYRRKLMIGLNLTRLTSDGEGRECETTEVRKGSSLLNCVAGCLS